MADTKRIAKNTIYMYLRMILVMGVTIYTSRVVLDKLGIEDYGLYNAISSVIAVMSFLNSTLSTSTSRFLAFDLGRGDISQLRKTFSTAFFSHLMLAGLIILVMESIGLWYMTNKFVVSEGREIASYVVFQISILITALSVCLVPFSGLVMAHEDIKIYAFIGIYEVITKLLIVYLLSISPFDKMVFYGVLLLLIQTSIALIYLILCKKKYRETNMSLGFNRKILAKMLNFAGWTAIANFSNSITVQGSILLLNLFFSPAIVATKALSNQITHAIMQFVHNFRVAMNPQIIKSYAASNFKESKKLTLQSTVISFDLMLIISLPFIFTMNTILDLWLVQVPEQAVVFAQWAVLAQIINTIPSSTYIPFVASGKQKWNGICGLISGLLFFLCLYLLYSIGCSAIWVQYLYVILVMVSVLLIRPILLNKEMGYQYKDTFICYWQCLKPFVSSMGIAFFLSLFWGNSLWHQILLFISIFISTFLCVLFFLEKRMRNYFVEMIFSKVKR